MYVPFLGKMYSKVVTNSMSSSAHFFSVGRAHQALITVIILFVPQVQEYSIELKIMVTAEGM